MLGKALSRLLRPDRHAILRLLNDSPVTVDDVLSVPRLDEACEMQPGCCQAWESSNA